MDLVAFTEEILNGKLHFLCDDDSEYHGVILIYLLTFTINLFDSSFNTRKLYFNFKTVYLGLRIGTVPMREGQLEFLKFDDWYFQNKYFETLLICDSEHRV